MIEFLGEEVRINGLDTVVVDSQEPLFRQPFLLLEDDAARNRKGIGHNKEISNCFAYLQSCQSFPDTLGVRIKNIQHLQNLLDELAFRLSRQEETLKTNLLSNVFPGTIAVVVNLLVACEVYVMECEVVCGVVGVSAVGVLVLGDSDQPRKIFSQNNALVHYDPSLFV